MAERTHSVAEKSRARRLNFATVFHRDEAGGGGARSGAPTIIASDSTTRASFRDLTGRLATMRFAAMHSSGTESGGAPRPAEAEDANDICAAFVIDADGNVLASNSTARELWRVEKHSLVATPFARLLVFDAAPAGGGRIVESWAALKAEIGPRWKACTARLHDGAEIAVRVRIERAFGGGGSYIAVVQPVTR